jgi:hypothetical protein
MSNKFEEIISLRSELERKIKSFGKEAITEGFTPLFTANPSIQGIVWTQYTPYFNDGEACVFGVGEPALIFSREMAMKLRPGQDFDDFDDNYVPWDHPQCFEGYSLSKTDLNMEKIGFRAIWNQIPEEVFLSVFGDHVKVTLMRDGTVTIDDYDHE